MSLNEDEAARLCAVVQGCLESKDIAPYFVALKGSAATYVPCRLRADLAQAHWQCCETLLGIGSSAPGPPTR